MLHFTHDGQTVKVDLEKLPLHEGLALQKATGMRLKEFMTAMEAADMEAFAALGWVLVKYRCGKPDVTFEDVAEGRIAVTLADFDDPEARKAAEGNGQVPPRGGKAKTHT